MAECVVSVSVTDGEALVEDLFDGHKPKSLTVEVNKQWFRPGFSVVNDTVWTKVGSLFELVVGVSGSGFPSAV